MVIRGVCSDQSDSPGSSSNLIRKPRASTSTPFFSPQVSIYLHLFRETSRESPHCLVLSSHKASAIPQRSPAHHPPIPQCSPAQHPPIPQCSPAQHPPIPQCSPVPCPPIIRQSSPPAQILPHSSCDEQLPSAHRQTYQ